VGYGLQMGTNLECKQTGVPTTKPLRFDLSLLFYFIIGIELPILGGGAVDVVFSI